MKKMMIALVAMLTIAATGHAMSYEQARNEALFLTDKMAYELNLTEAQYEAAYEINLDYLMGVTSYDDVYSTYWERRNLDLSYILFDWQWEAFCAASYFYRPLYWDGGYWHFGIYARYPHRDYFYFGRPVFYASYRGGHAWHHVGGHGYYYHHRDHYRPAPAPGRSHFGMLDRWNRGDYRAHHSGSQRHGQTYRQFGGNRNSSTRTTVDNRGRLYTDRGTGHIGGSHDAGRGSSHSSSGYDSGRSTSHSGSSHSGSGSGSGRSFGENPNRSSSSHSSGSFSGSRSSFNSDSRTSRSSGSFSGSSSRNSFSGSSSSMRSSGSFSGGSSRSGGSFSGGSHSSSGGGRSSSGGRSYGGHR
jgi:hypothetical protein